MSSTVAWRQLDHHCRDIFPTNTTNVSFIFGKENEMHLRHLLENKERARVLTAEAEGIYIDFARQRMLPETMSMLFDLAEQAKVKEKIAQMAAGVHINTTENRAVGHMALRAFDGDTYEIDGKNVVPDVLNVRYKIREFTNQVRNGQWRGHTGKTITAAIAVGIGGSYLGAQFVYEALKSDATAAAAAKGRQLRFLANVDPVAVERTLDGLNPETTLVVIISKTFTTRETMLNAKTVRQWIVNALGEEAVTKHMVAVSTNEQELTKFGIDPKNAFGFWDWVGGRYSVSSAVGVLPLALQYGYSVVERFLAGARSIDQNFQHASPRQNLPLILGLIGVWNNNFLNYRSRALICYSEAMNKLAPHIQQVDMESNGKCVTLDNQGATYNTGEANFGEPGTNSQHSFFQLLHQGNNVIPVDFVGFVHSQHDIHLKGEKVTNHEDLMANFFAQPDALAFGKTFDELRAENVDDKLLPHRHMPGNRPSTVILFNQLSAYEVGQILALYEHRTAVEGFIWNINSFDQFGVELGKKLADKVRTQLASAKNGGAISGFNPSTTVLLERFLKQSGSFNIVQA